MLLDDATLHILIPKAGPRLKFKKYFDKFLSENQADSDPAVIASDPAVIASDPAVIASDSTAIASNPAAIASDSAATASDPVAITSTPAAFASDSAAIASDSAGSVFSTQFPTCSSSNGSKNFNLKEIVRKKLPDIFNKLEKGDPAEINILHKYKLNRVIVASFIEKYGCRATTKDKLDLAKNIITTFPVLKGAEGEAFVSNFY